jgi:predicted transcriptional regulator
VERNESDMMDVHKSAVLDTDIKRLMIPAQNVACVQPGNSLEHALLVLIKSGYSAIPVLDTHSTVKGTISKTLILDGILGLERIEFEKLSDRTVETVMNDKVVCLKETDSFFRAVELSINNPFLSVVNEGGVFVGILTRKAILALLYQSLRQ